MRTHASYTRMNINGNQTACRLVLMSAAALLILLTARPGLGQTGGGDSGQRVEVLAETGGFSGASAQLTDGSLIIGQGDTLLRLVSTESGWLSIAENPTGYGTILDMKAVGTRVYVLTASGVFLLPDASVNLTPTAYQPGGGQRITYGGPYLAVSAGEAGVRLYALDADGVPSLSATLHADFPLLDTAFSPDNTTLYAAADEGGVLTFELAAGHTAPPGTLNAPAPVERITRMGGVLLLAGAGRITAFDPTPGAQGALGTFSGMESARRAVRDADTLYVADEAHGLRVFQFADPDRPIQLFGEVDTPALDVTLADGVAYVAGESGLRIYDVSLPARPLLISSLPLAATPVGVAVDGGRAYLPLRGDGVAVVDVSNRAAPEMVTTLSLPDRAQPPDPHAALIHDGMLYVAAGDAGLFVYSLRGSNPVFLADVLLPGPALDLDRRGTFLAAAMGESGLAAIDVLRPQAPALMGTVNAPGTDQFDTVTVSGRRALVAGGDSAGIIDIGDPTRMGIIATMEGPASDALIEGIYLVTVGGPRITVYDARANAEPVFLRESSGISAVSTWATQDNLLALASTDNVLTVISFDEPDRPFERDSAILPGPVQHLHIANNTVWLASGFGGVSAYQLATTGALLPQADGLANLPQVTGLAGANDTVIQGGERAIMLPGHPAPVDLPGMVYGITTDGEWAAAALGEAGVAFIDAEGTVGVYSGFETVTDAATWDDLVITAESGGLGLYDPVSARLVAQVPLPAPVIGVTVTGDLAYAALGNGQLAIVVLRDPRAAFRINRELAGLRPLALAAGEGDRFYLLEEGQISELSTASGVLEVLREGEIRFRADDIAVDGGQIIALTGDDTLRTYRIATLGSYPIPSLEVPRLAAIGSVQAWEPAPGGVLMGGDSGLIQIGLPALTTVQPSTDPVHALLIDGDTLLTASSTLDVRSLAQPDQVVASLTLSGPATVISTGPDDTYLIGMENGLMVVRWRHGTLTLVGDLSLPDGVDQIAWSNSRAYLATPRGMGIVSLDDPGHPELLLRRTAHVGTQVMGLAITADGGVLAAWDQGVEWLHAEQVMLPEVVQLIDLPASPSGRPALAEDETQIAIPVGSAGVAHLRMDDGGPPVLFDTPGTVDAVVIRDNLLYAADGVCGLRVLDIATSTEAGTWRGGYAGDLIANPGGAGVLIATGQGMITAVYDPSLPVEPPPQPDMPNPAPAAADVSRTPELSWGPTVDPCNPLTYEVYFGVGDDPPLIEVLAGQPSLVLADLDPLRVYTWRVEVSDRQGDRTVGPTWQFTTESTGQNLFPQAPPLFGQRLRLRSTIPFVLLLVLMAGGLTWLIVRRSRDRNRRGK